MKETPDVYRRLQKHIDVMPVGFPATASGVELSILRRLFTPEEAEAALLLSALPEPLSPDPPPRAAGAGRRPSSRRSSTASPRRARSSAAALVRAGRKKLWSKAMLASGCTSSRSTG